MLKIQGFATAPTSNDSKAQEAPYSFLFLRMNKVQVWGRGTHRLLLQRIQLLQVIESTILTRTEIVAINVQLPSTPETLWLRLLGNGSTQQQAIAEVLNFPVDHPR